MFIVKKIQQNKCGNNRDWAYTKFVVTSTLMSFLYCTQFVQQTYGSGVLKVPGNNPNTILM